MGKVVKNLGYQKISRKTVFSKRISIEKAETIHLHYRNLRLEFSKKNFLHFAESVNKAYENFINNGGRKVPGQTFLEINTGFEEDSIISPDSINIEYCQNLYAQNKNNIFGRNAEFYEDDLYYHVHYRDLRMEMPSSEFYAFAQAFIASYVSQYQSAQGNIYVDLKSLFTRLNANNINYVVIRNWDKLLRNSIEPEHPDIDLLIAPEDIPKFDFLANSTLTNLETYRVQRKILVNIKNKPTYVFVDVRTSTDKYFPEKLSLATLKEKESKKFINIPSKKYHFLTLLYHAHFHKKEITDQYKKVLLNLYNPSWFKFDLSKIDNRKYVIIFFNKLGYDVVEPFDKSVYFHPLEES